MQNILQDNVDRLLTQEGFSRKKLIWTKNLGMTTVLLELQKSEWGNQYYINLGVGLNKLEMVKKENQCHIRGRLSDLIDNEEELDKYLDLEDESITDSERGQYVSDKIQNFAVPFFIKMSDENGIKKFLETPESQNFLVSLKLRKQTGLP